MTKSEAALMVVVLIVAGVAGRVLPHMPNFAPVTATALFCGAHMSKRSSVAATFVILLASDYLLLYINPFGTTSFAHFYAPWELWHRTLPYIYASFGISAAVGWYVKHHYSVSLAVVAASLCAVQFFLISNAGVWMAGGYDRGIDGLWQSYVAALPFFRGTLFGDLVYTALFFGLWQFYANVKHASWGRRTTLQTA